RARFRVTPRLRPWLACRFRSLASLTPRSSLRIPERGLLGVGVVARSSEGSGVLPMSSRSVGALRSARLFVCRQLVGLAYCHAAGLVVACDVGVVAVVLSSVVAAMVGDDRGEQLAGCSRIHGDTGSGRDR